MSFNQITIPIAVTGKEVELCILGENIGSNLFVVSDAIENGEAPIQIVEGYNYEYKITPGFRLEPSLIVKPSKINESWGRISPNIYVGTVTIKILDSNNVKCGAFNLEIQSSKADYREDYRHMLDEITEKCTELLLQHNSPVSHYFEANFSVDARTLYQRFAFIKSILDSDEFNDTIHKIISAPVTKWKERETIKDIRGIKRINNSALRQISSSTNRINLPNSHPLITALSSIPSRIRITHKTETIDTPENRFVKHALLYFQSFCNDFKSKLEENSRVNNEAGLLVDKLEQYLSHSIFKEISTPTTLPLNSPVLQRKEGYRELLRVWLMFDLASKLIWHGGDDVYSGNKKDVAVLYEYWLFFKLLDIIKEVFNIDSLAVEQLLEQTNNGIGLKLKQGKYLPIQGEFITESRKLRIEFSYNKTFSGDNKYPDGGSWTRDLRPDYTLSMWPSGISAAQAEKEELIVHIHFDAKYKVEDIRTIFGDNDNLDEEKEEQKRGTYKRADLLKMHTYKDAIRRTAGAYILYPGTEKGYTRAGFHELIPGLGAFSIRPLKTNDGTAELKSFLFDIVGHFLNRASQRERMSLKTYQTHRSSPTNKVNVAFPEAFGPNRNLIPDETYILVGYYKSERHLQWIINSGLYNTRAETQQGTLSLEPGVAGANYLLLHTKGQTTTGKLFKIVEMGPKIISKKALVNLKYPTEPSREYYLIYRIEKAEPEFANREWDISELSNFKKGSGSGLPFSTSLTELMNCIVP